MARDSGTAASATGDASRGVPLAGKDAGAVGSNSNGSGGSNDASAKPATSDAGSTAASDGGAAADVEECVEDKSMPTAAQKGGSGNGQVLFYSPTGNPLTRFRTKLLVPKPPTKNGVLFLWPGLQPVMGAPNYNPIGLGVLQPVLTWGASCAPNHLGQNYDSWWISSQYVNTYGNSKGHMGCYGGDSMKVAVGDVLDIDMSLSGTSWTQTVTDEKTGKSVDFTIDMAGQDQNEALFIIEDTYDSPSEDVIFLSSILTYKTPAASACKVGSRGANDFVVTPRPLKDGLECCIPRVVLRARGVAMSSPN